ncbi:TonB-dependent receptor [Flavivirga amylovorans]
MRLTTFLLIVSLFQIHANTTYGQKTKITLNVENVSLENALNSIESLTEFKFMYNDSEVNYQRIVSVHAKRERVSNILEKLFLNTDVVFEVLDKQIILKRSKFEDIVLPEKVVDEDENQQFTVNGTIKDVNGQPLAGANVIEKGTSNGIVTDFDGNFSLNVSSQNATLVISYLGFTSKEVSVAGQSSLNVTLEEDAAALDEVVVIGYGSTTKRDLTGSVANANLETATETSNVSIVQALQGSIAGLNVGAVTSAGQNPSLSIRGQNTLSSNGGDNAPLIVLDGIIYRGSIIDLNPDDIASMDILKDISSTAIYGSQAANGVILITSKTGRTSSKPTFNFSSSYTVQTPSNRFEPMNAAEYEEFYPDIFWDRGGRIGPDFLQVDPSYVWQNNFKTTEISEGYAAGLDTPWNDLLTGNGHQQTHNLSISGRGESVSYFVSGGFTDQEAFIKNDTYRRYNFRVNLDAKLNDWLNIGTQTFVAVSDYSGQSANYDATPLNNSNNSQHAYYYLQPWAPIRDDQDVLIPNPEGGWLNPFLALEVDNSDVRLNLSSVLYANIKLPIEGLSYRANYSNNYRTRDLANFDPSAASFQGEAFKTHSLAWDWSFDNILTYKKTFAEDHNINATFVYGVEKRHFNGTDARSSNFVVKILGYNRLEAGDSSLNQVFSGKEEESSLYQMGRLLYNYKNKYFFTGTVRRDGFSGFGINNKTAVFPSAAIGWVVTEESFANDSSWLNYLKFRFSYGQSGRRGVGRYDTLAQVDSTPSVVFGDGGQTFLGQEPTTLANNSLGWETTTGANYGLDFTLFNNRINGTFEYYSNKTEDILFEIDLPVITGFEDINTNLAEVSNSGIELTLSSNIVDKGDWKWNTSVNFNRVRNKVESILGVDNDGDGIEDDLISNNRTDGLFIGEPQRVYYDYEIIGMWQLADAADGSIWPGFLPGTYKLNDLDGSDDISLASDRKIIGYRDPSYRFGIANTVSYKNLSMYVFLNSIQGGKDYYFGDDAPHSTGNWNKADQLSYSNVPKGAWDYWMPENPNAKYRRLDDAGQFPGTPYTQRSFVRLQDVTISYNFPNKLIEKLSLSNLKLFVSGKNLATWTKWNGSDPETGVGFRPDNPLLKSYTMGLNVQF